MPMKRLWRRISWFLIVCGSLSLICGSVDAEWTLSFTERDIAGGYSNSYKDYSALTILVDDKVVGSYPTLSGDYNYGRQTIDLTSYVTEGKSRVSFKLVGRRQGLLLYDIEILHDGKPVKFTPWASEKSDPRVRCLNYSETRLVMMLGTDLDDGVDYNGIFTTQPLKDAPELEVKQSDLSFSKPIYKIMDGDHVQVNVTVRNLGAIAEKDAHVELYVDGIRRDKSDGFSIEGGGSVTKSFDLLVDFMGGKYVKVQAIVIPSEPDAEGRKDNNQAVKYLVRRPYMLFTDVNQTPVKRYWGQSPYTGWVSELEYGLRNCMAYDFSSPSVAETVKASCMSRLALYYQLTGDEAYAEKARDGLTRIGDNGWVWADRSKAGNAAKGSLDRGTNENYGITSIHGATWGQVLFQYSVAYDWIHNYAVEYDEKHGTDSVSIIRDKLARMSTDSYLLLKEVYSYGDFGTGISAFAFGDYGTGRLALEGPFGIAAMSLMDYDGKYQDTDGNPDEWVRFVEQDLAVESRAGAKRSNLDQHISRDGLYEEGGGYRDYYEPSVSSFVALYNNVLGVNMAEKYPLVDGCMKDVPLTMSPNGRYPNLCVSYASVWYAVANSLMVYDVGTPERSLINFYIRNVILQSRGYRGESGDWGTYYTMLFYDKNEPADPPVEPTSFSPYGGMNVLRSGWDRDALYAFMKAPNEPTMSGHAPLELHQLSFDIWAKGAYPVVDAGNARFLKYGGSGTYGHTSWLVTEDGQEKSIERDMKGQYGETCHNPAYITSKMTGQDIDFVQGQMAVKHWWVYPSSGAFKVPFNVVRDLALIGGEYFIAYDTLEADGENTYSMLIPFGSANGHTGDPKNPSDNWALGELSFDGQRRSWFDYSKIQPIQQDLSNVTELMWETVSETNKIEQTPSPVNMTVHLNPSADVSVRTIDMHYGSYGQEYEWAIPLVKVKQAGKDVRYLTVYYPTADTEEKPSIRTIPVDSEDGLARATRVSKGEVEDLIVAGDGLLISAQDVTTNARLTAVRRVNGTAHNLFFEGGTGVVMGGKTIISSTRLINGAVGFNAFKITGTFDSIGPFTIFISTGGMKVAGVSFNKKSMPFIFDGSTLQVDLPGPGELDVISSENASANTGQAIVMPPVMSIEKQGATTIRQPNMTESTSKSMPYRIPLGQSKSFKMLILIFFALLVASIVIIVYIKRYSR